MSYLNPLLSYGSERLTADATKANVSGFIIPDLPFEECAAAAVRCSMPQELALVQMMTPVTPPARLAMLADESRGFVYAVTMTGTTGAAVAADGELIDYLRRVRERRGAAGLRRLRHPELRPGGGARPGMRTA